MAQCEGTTKKGERCARSTRAGSSYCGIHIDQERQTRSPTKRKKRTAKKARDTLQVELLPEMPEAPDEEVKQPSHEEPSAEVQDDLLNALDVSPEPISGKTEHPGVELRPVSEPGAEAGTAQRAESEPKIRSSPDEPDAPSVPRPQGNELARARDLVQSGRIEEAIARYLEILVENPQNLRAHNNLGILFDELGQHDTAVEHFEAALEVEPKNVEVRTNLASALTKLGRFDAADTSILQALRLSPDDPDARLIKGILSFRRGLYSQVESDLRWVCERDPEFGEAFYYRAEALNRTGHFAEAAKLMLRAAELLPDDPRPFYTLGHLYDRQNRFPEAADMYRRARDCQVS